MVIFAFAILSGACALDAIIYSHSSPDSQWHVTSEDPYEDGIIDGRAAQHPVWTFFMAIVAFACLVSIGIGGAEILEGLGVLGDQD